MGEIADALRRARGQLSSAAPSPRLRPVEAEPEPAAVPLTSLGAPQARPPAPRPAKARLEHFAPHSPGVILEGPNAEACRHLALRGRSALQARRARSLAVVSGERGDGKTTVACDLAIALATLSDDGGVALVDLDLRRPSVADYLSVPSETGVEEILKGRASLEDVCVPVATPLIDLYPVGAAQGDAHRLLVLPAAAELIAELERRYEVVVVDTPPAPLVPDANLLLRHVAGCVPVVRAGKTRMRSFRKLLACLPREQILGWVVNGEREAHFGYQDYYYGEEPPETKSRWSLGGRLS